MPQTNHVKEWADLKTGDSLSHEELREMVANGSRKEVREFGRRHAKALPPFLAQAVIARYNKCGDANAVVDRLLHTDVDEFVDRDTLAREPIPPEFAGMPMPSGKFPLWAVLIRTAIRDDRFFAREYARWPGDSEAAFREAELIGRECDPEWFSAKRVADQLLFQSLCGSGVSGSSARASSDVRSLVGSRLRQPTEACHALVCALPAALELTTVSSVNPPEVAALRRLFAEARVEIERLEAQLDAVPRVVNATRINGRRVFAMAVDAILCRCAPKSTVADRLDIAGNCWEGKADGTISRKSLDNCRRAVREGKLPGVAHLFNIYAKEFPHLPVPQ